VEAKIFFLVRLTAIFILSIASTGFSEGNPSLRFSPCKSQIRSILQEWKSKEEWQKHPADNDQFLFYTPTEKIGVWIDLKELDENGIEIARVESTNITQMKFSAKNCKPEISVSKLPNQPQGIRIFSDEKIREKIATGKKGFIYTWSPAMPLSVDGVSEIKKAAEEMKVALIVILDKNANKKTASVIVRKNGWPEDYLSTNTSLELRYRGAFNHFPSALVFKDSKISPKIIPGLRNATFYANQAKEFGL
jgi:hypothetical protein